VTRVARLGPRFLDALDRVGARTGTPRGKAVAAAIAALTRDAPGPQDKRGLRPPSGAPYWVRRVPKENLWIFYVVRDGEVVIETVIDHPPAPSDD
jgi:hypothetical protein